MSRPGPSPPATRAPTTGGSDDLLGVPWRRRAREAVRRRARRARDRVGPLVRRALAGALGAAAVAMAVSALVGGLRDGRAVGGMAASAGICGALALAAWLSVRGRSLGSPTSREGLLAAGLSWVACGLVGTLPFLLTGALDDPAHALFESVSGFTTTGATVLDDIDAQPDAILLWRSLMHWLGGVGIVVLLVAVVPVAGGAARRVLLGETSRANEDLIAPRIRDTARITASIYVGFTAFGTLLLVAVGMSGFDAVNHAMSSVATGGFSTHTASAAWFDSATVEAALMVLMVGGGVSFVLWWRLATRREVRPHLPELRAYLGVLLVVGLGTALALAYSDAELALSTALRDGLFTSVSLVTTTGFVTEDFDQWDDRVRMLALLAMLSGACVGSTSGGVKIRRWLVLAAGLRAEVARQLSPRRVVVARVGHRPVPEETVRAAFGFVAVAAVIVVASSLLLTGVGVDAASAVTGSLACLMNVGPALSEVGATESFSQIPDAGLVGLSAVMLLGRLEIFTVLALLSRAFWRAR